MKKYYSELSTNENVVMEVLKNEKIKFNSTLEKGLREFEKIVKNLNEKVHIIIGLIDNFCHEIVYHAHKSLNYDEMKKEVINIVLYLLKD